MGRFFNRERFGNAQIAAGLLLLVFVAECAWLIAHEHASTMPVTDEEFARVEEGVGQWHGRAIAGTPTMPNPSPELSQINGGRFDRSHSPLWYLIASAPVEILDVSTDHWLWVWLTRAPYVAFGTLLGGSLWYVSRRLYGNAGGFIALGLYCFSPTIIRASCLWYAPPQIGAAWGLFGAVFTAIAVSHTLYAPREVILWNWRRIVLLGVSLALAVGSQFQLAIVIPLLLAFMLYLAPDRKSAGIIILGSACVIALGLLFGCYFFHPGLFWQGLMEAKWFDVSGRALGMSSAYLQVGKEVIASGPVMAVLVPASLLAFAIWRRSRYFGNAAPLMVALLFAFFRAGSPHPADSIHSLAAVIFLFVLVAGISADLLESKFRNWVMAVLPGILGANALWNLLSLSGVVPGRH
jgi:hypothetical protein